jgi:preprotein translocase subunit SecE
VSDDQPGRENARETELTDGLTDEDLDREAPGVDDAAELEAAEAEVAAEAEADEDKVVTGRSGGARRRAGRITAATDEDEDEDEDDEPVATRSRRAARTASRPATREGAGTRSRAAAERAREPRRRRSVRRFLREVVAELRKVIWPGRRELITYTTVVIVFVAFIVALVAGLDLLFAKGVLAVFG